jgi:hypothetical protein
MSWSPLSAGDGRASHHTFTTDSGVFSLAGLTGTNIAMHLEDVNNSYALYVCTGTWSITDAANGKADFAPSSDDLLPTHPLGKPGVYKAYPVVTLATGPVAMDAQTLTVTSAP